MKVLVMTAVARNEQDLQIVMVAQLEGGVRVSQIATLRGGADGRNGNPYCVYGDIVADWLDCDKFAPSISVFSCTSGDLKDWL